MFQLFDHTADLGLRIEADSLPQLLADAGAGLLAILAADPGQVRPAEKVEIELPGGPADLLLFDWLSELLYLFESEGWLLAKFDITLDDKLQADAWGQRRGPQHELEHEVKAITYHQLQAAEVDGRWQAEVIVDI